MTEEEKEKYDELELSSRIHGTPVSRLVKSEKIHPSDVFLVTRRRNISTVSAEVRILNENFDGAILLEDGNTLVNEESAEVVSSECSSMGMEYHVLCSDIVRQAEGGLNFGTMAWENENDYARTGHNHDDIYTKFNILDAYHPTEKVVKLMTLHLSNFAEDGTVDERTVDIVAPELQMPKVDETI